jgi:hypothetical protein
MVLPFLDLAPVAVGMDELRVIVLVLVVRGAVLELAQDTARMVVGDVVVIVGVDDIGMGMLVRDITDDVLHRCLSQGAPPEVRVHGRPCRGVVRI